MEAQLPSAQRADRRLCRTARHAPDGGHAVPPEAAGQRHRFCPARIWPATRLCRPRSPRFPGLAPAPIRGTTACRRRCTSASAWASNTRLSYTFSQGMSDSIGYYGEGGQAGGQSAYMQNLYDRKSEWGPTYFDNKHAFTGSFVYELPFGQRKKFGSHWNRAVDGVLGGWQMGGIYTAHTGFPLTIKMSGDPSGTGARSFRANVIGTPNDPHQIGPGAAVPGSDRVFGSDRPYLRQRRRRNRSRTRHEPLGFLAAASSSTSPKNGTSNCAPRRSICPTRRSSPARLRRPSPQRPSDRSEARRVSAMWS